MNILETKAVQLPISVLVNNEGQIEGVPANPRVLRDEKYEALKASMQNDNLTGVLPLKVYQQGNEYIVLGGNMRLQVLKELGAEQVSCIIVPNDTPADVLRKIVITDNSTFGDWDMDMLANEWEEDELKDWGVELPLGDIPSEEDVMGLFENAGEAQKEDMLSIKVQVPKQYEGNIEDMRGCIRVTLADYEGVKVE